MISPSVASLEGQTATTKHPSSNTVSDYASDWRVGLALAVLVFVVAAPIMHPRGGLQQASRYALTAALWDHNTVELDDYRHVLGRDHAMRDGVVYSDKAPGQPFMAVPFYGIYRLVGGEAAEDGDITGLDWGLWWVTLWTSVIPASVLAALMYKWSREVAPERALMATATISLGTLLLVYATLLFGHVLAAVFIFAMFFLIRSPRASTLTLFAGGVLGGAAVLTEYPMALVVVVLLIAALVRHGSAVLKVIAGGLPAVAFLAWYNWRVAGSPFVLSYQWTGFSGPMEAEGEVLHMFTGPESGRIIEILFSGRGLLVATPVLIVALLGVVMLWRRGHKLDSLVAVGALIALFAVQANWGSSFAGGAGPRYMTPAMPFLAAPLALAWQRWSRATLGLAGLSIFTMLLATLTEPQLASDTSSGLALWLTIAVDEGLTNNLFGELLGGLGWLVYFSLIGAGAWVLARQWSLNNGPVQVTSDPQIHDSRTAMEQDVPDV